MRAGSCGGGWWDELEVIQETFSLALVHDGDVQLAMEVISLGWIASDRIYAQLDLCIFVST